MATRMRIMWKKFKKWLKYHPEKHYLGGKLGEKTINN